MFLKYWKILKKMRRKWNNIWTLNVLRGLIVKLNCWEFMKCGRQPGGEKVDELGVCPASIEPRTDGTNSGKMGGRVLGDHLEDGFVLRRKSTLLPFWRPGTTLPRSGASRTAGRLQEFFRETSCDGRNRIRNIGDAPFTAIVLSVMERLTPLCPKNGDLPRSFVNSGKFWGG